MKTTIKRTIGGAVLGATLAVSAAALAAVPANAAAPGVTANSSSPTSAVTPGQTNVPTTITYTLNPTANESLQTGTFFLYWATDNLTTAPAKISYNGTDVTNQFTCAPVGGLSGIWGHSASQIQCNLTAAGFPLTAGNPAQFKVTVDSTVSAAAPKGDRAEIGMNANFVTPSGTTWANSSYITNAGGTNKNTMTVADVSDIPVIAPAIAGIALLGAAGAGGGIALGRRKKAKAHA